MSAEVPVQSFAEADAEAKAVVPTDPKAFDAPRGERTAADGLVIVDKPQGWTSHDVVGRLRRMGATRKVGHAGTLDPMATGVLVLGIGRATRLLTHIVGTDKEYVATIRLGATTVTDDAEGDITTAPGVAAGAGFDGTAITAEALEGALQGMRGDIEQTPSTVSAIKVDGKRSYARVRAGEKVELKARPITVSRFEVTGEPTAAIIQAGGGAGVHSDTGNADVAACLGGENGANGAAGNDPGFTEAGTGAGVSAVTVLDVPVLVECSSGTYVRALARDLGEALGVGGHLTMLRRTRVGPFHGESAQSITALAEAVSSVGELPVMDLTAACTALFPTRHLSESEAAAVRFGKFLAWAEPADSPDGAPDAASSALEAPSASPTLSTPPAPSPRAPSKLIAALAPEGNVVALLERRGNKARPVLVLDPA